MRSAESSLATKGLRRAMLVLLPVFAMYVATNNTVTCSDADASRLLGGRPDEGSLPHYPCKYAETICPDPNGLGTICLYHAEYDMCMQCRMSVASYEKCKFSIRASPNSQCMETVGPNSPFCGQVWVDFPNPLTEDPCPLADCNVKDGACGRQIPTVSGHDCPP